MKTDLYNFQNEKVGIVDLPDEWFNVPWRPVLVTQVVRAQEANRRRPWAHAKDRSEVRGGGKKPWKQKGTGRARHGSTRSPIWIGGGKAHGPRNARDYSQKINKKMRRGALASVLSKKLKDEEIKFIESIAVNPPKTKIIAASLRAVLGLTPRQNTFHTLIVRDPRETQVTRAARNLIKTKVVSPSSLNVEDLLRYKHVLFDKQAVEILGNMSQ